MRIRLATPADAGVLIGFNAAMALETKGKELLPEVIGAGVHSLLANPAAGFFDVVAEQDGLIGSLMSLSTRPAAGRQRSEGMWLPAIR